MLGNLSRGEAYARATDHDRTRASVAALLTGLLGLDSKAAAPRHSVHLHVHERREEETMLGWGLHDVRGPAGSRSRCPRAAQLHASQVAAFRSSPGVLEGLERVLGPGAAAAGPGAAADFVVASRCAGGPLPCGAGGCVGPGLARRLIRDAERRFRERCAGAHGGTAASRLAFQPLLAELALRLRQAAHRGHPSAGGGAAAAPRLAVLGGHDTTLGHVAAALGVFNGKWPPFATRLIFELWRLPTTDAALRVLVNGRVVTGAIEGCSREEFCPLEKFEATVRALLGGHSTLAAACAV